MKNLLTVTHGDSRGEQFFPSLASCLWIDQARRKLKGVVTFEYAGCLSVRYSSDMNFCPKDCDIEANLRPRRS